jgi:hypothetical protein
MGRVIPILLQVDVFVFIPNSSICSSLGVEGDSAEVR